MKCSTKGSFLKLSAHSLSEIQIFYENLLEYLLSASHY